VVKEENAKVETTFASPPAPSTNSISSGSCWVVFAVSQEVGVSLMEHVTSAGGAYSNQLAKSQVLK